MCAPQVGSAEKIQGFAVRACARDPRFPNHGCGFRTAIGITFGRHPPPTLDRALSKAGAPAVEFRQVVSRFNGVARGPADNPG
jgi:hypothetical protein